MNAEAGQNDADADTENDFRNHDAQKDNTSEHVEKVEPQKEKTPDDVKLYSIEESIKFVLLLLLIVTITLLYVCYV